ncbi:MAG: right-handed parallel beta-helix repeat-containing protein [Cyanobacteria bacterium P01_H01_bin.21]
MSVLENSFSESQVTSDSLDGGHILDTLGLPAQEKPLGLAAFEEDATEFYDDGTLENPYLLWQNLTATNSDQSFTHDLYQYLSNQHNLDNNYSDASDPLLKSGTAVNARPGSHDEMLFYAPDLAFSQIETVTDTFANNASNTIVAGISSRESDLNDGTPDTIDITDLPTEILQANPGVDSAVANDGVDDAAAIRAVVNWAAAERKDGASDQLTIYIPEGTFDLAETVRVNTTDVILKGAGQGRTVLQNADDFRVGTAGLPDEEIDFKSIDQKAYLLYLNRDADDVTVTDMTLTGPNVHGGILSDGTHNLVIKNLELNNFLWSSIRLFSVRDAKIHDNVFIDAGGRVNGITGGSIFATYLKSSEIYNNDISESGIRGGEVYGIKGREFRNTRIYNNTISASFAIELPFEHDRFVEIDHNYLDGVVSLPRLGGGGVPKDGYTFHIHHNYFTRSYALEWARNGVEVNHNVFAFDTDQDNGNLITNFSEKPAKGPTKFHNNLILNPGRGVVWHKSIYNNFSFYNNTVIANETVNSRADGLFGFHEKTDFSTIEIRDNVIEVNGLSRPLMRNQASYDAVIKNNQLSNISDVDSFDNPDTGAPQGVTESLQFRVGANGELAVNGAEIRPAAGQRSNTPQFSSRRRAK